MKDVLSLPSHCSFALTTGCSLAHITAIASARHHFLDLIGWEDGLVGAPNLSIL
jgi:hypothetical protein